MIKTIIFDNAGVLCDGDSEKNFFVMEKYLSMPFSIFVSVWNREVKDLDSGVVTFDYFVLKFLKILNKPELYEDFKRCYFSCYKIKKDMHVFAKSLCENFEVVLLSNFGDEFDLFNKKWKLDKIFGEKMFVSYKIGLRKPDSKIYLYVLKELNRRPEDVIFIDDSLENVEGAEAVGIKGILFTDLEQLKNDLKQYL